MAVVRLILQLHLFALPLQESHESYIGSLVCTGHASTNLSRCSTAKQLKAAKNYSSCQFYNLNRIAPRSLTCSTLLPGKNNLDDPRVIAGGPEAKPTPSQGVHNSWKDAWHSSSAVPANACHHLHMHRNNQAHLSPCQKVKPCAVAGWCVM